MKVVLHLIDSLDRGGAETLLVGYLSELKNYQNVVVILQGPNRFEKEIKPFVFYNLQSGGKKNLPGAVMKIRKLIKRHRVNIIHSHSYWTNIIARIAAPRKVQVVNHYHFADYGTMNDKPSVKRMIWLDKLIGHPFLKRIAVSEYIGHLLLEVLGNKRPVLVVANFIRNDHCFEQPKNFRGNWLRMVAVGSIKKEKGYTILLEAFGKLKNDPVSIDVFGGGEKLEWFKNKLIESDITNIRFKGNSDTIAAELVNYDMYCSTSVSETFGMALLEAVCAGLPLLVSDIPAFREVAPDGTCFFKCGDADDLVKAIRQILQLGYNISEESYRSKLRYYSKDKFLVNLNHIYED